MFSLFSSFLFSRMLTTFLHAVLLFFTVSLFKDVVDLPARCSYLFHFSYFLLSTFWFSRTTFLFAFHFSYFLFSRMLSTTFLLAVHFILFFFFFFHCFSFQLRMSSTFLRGVLLFFIFSLFKDVVDLPARCCSSPVHASPLHWSPRSRGQSLQTFEFHISSTTICYYRRNMFFFFSKIKYFQDECYCGLTRDCLIGDSLIDFTEGVGWVSKLAIFIFNEWHCQHWIRQWHWSILVTCVGACHV